MIRPGTCVLLILLLPLAALLGALGSVAPAAAATITVDTCDFEGLWSAIREAASGDTITFACSGTIDADVFATHHYDITKDLTIDGTGQNVTLDGGGRASLFLANQITLTLKGLTLTNGSGGSYAPCQDCPTTDYGGVVTQWGGTLNIINSTFRNNEARSIGGGGVIFSLLGTLNISNSTFSDNFTDMEGGVLQSIRSTVNVSNSTFSNNTAYEDGGAISISSGTVMISGSTFDGNVATYHNANGAGGAIHNSGNSTMTIINSTFSGNQAEIGGAIANNDTTIDVINSTLVGNTATLYGNGVVNGRRALIGLSGGGTTRFTNTILANADVPPRGSDGFHLLGYNCGGLGTFFIAASTFSDDISCNMFIIPTPPAAMQLGPLADNGGPTQTIALLPGSILIDRATCQAAAPTDQRGYARPATGLRTCDVGAYEVGGIAPMQTATLSAISGAGVYEGTATLTARLTADSTSIGNQSINFYLNGASVGSATTGSDGVATLPGASLAGFAAGTYASIVGASFVGGGIYTGANGNGPLTVSQSTAAIALDAATLTQTYANSPRSVTATTTPPGLSYSIDYAGSATPPTNAGSYAVSATITDPGYVGSISGTLTVNQAEQSISFTSTAPGSAIYGDTYAPTASAGSGNAVALAASGACTFDSGPGVVTMIAVGTCTVTAEQAGDANYAAAAQQQQSFAVARASLSVSANAATMAFGGSLPTLDATVTGLVNGDSFVGLGGSCSAAVNGSPVSADTPTGTYPGAITCSGVDAKNYDVAYTPDTLTVTAAPVFVSDDHVTFQTGTVGAFTMAVTGFPSATFSTADPLPAGVTLGADGLLTGLTNDADAGVYVLNVVASNGTLPDATQVFTLTVEIPDTTPPEVTQLAVSFTTSGAQNGTVPLLVTWTATDDIGLVGSRMQVQVNGGTWVRQYVSPSATSKIIKVPAGSTYRVRMRAVDAAGNASIWKLSQRGSTTLIEQDAGSVSYTGKWSTGTIAGSADGQTRRSTTRDASATVQFTGTSIAWVSARNSMRGLAEVSIDGVYLETVDLYAPSGSGAWTVFTRSGLATGNHSLTVKVLNDAQDAATGTFVVIDGFIVGN